MKKVILLLIATVAGLSCFAEKTYTMTLADENNPGKMISYNIVEPLFKDNNNNFLARMYKYMGSPNLVEKRKNLNSVGVTSRGSDETKALQTNAGFLAQSDGVSSPGFSLKGKNLMILFVLDENGFPTNPQIIENKGFNDTEKLLSIFTSSEPIDPGYINGNKAPFTGLLKMSGEDGVRIIWSPMIGTASNVDLQGMK